MSRPEAPPRTRQAGRAEPRSLLPPAIVAVALLVFFLVPLAVAGHRLPVGPDVPYYVWSTRLAGETGLSVTGFRPGFHALLLVLSGTTGTGPLQAVAPLALALAAAAGLAAAAVAEAGLGRDPVRFVVVGAVAGAYTARLASGFLANLLFAALFLAAAAALLGGDSRERRRVDAVAGAGGLLVAAGLAHGLFLVYATTVLLTAALVRLVALPGPGTSGREDALDVGATVLIGGAVGGLGLAASSVGAVLRGERLQSRDALLRLAGLRERLRGAFLVRWREAVPAFLLPLTVPLGAVGAWAAGRSAREPRRRLFASFLLAWAGVTAAGVALALVTDRFPAGRVLAAALVLPFLAALGTLAAARLARPGWVRGAVLVLIAAALLSAPYRSWSDSRPFVSEAELDAVAAAASVASVLPEGTPLVFVVDRGGPHPGIQLTRYANVIRMGLPAERIEDVRLFVGGAADYRRGRPRLTGDEEHDAFARLAFPSPHEVLGGPHAAFLVRPFNEPGWERTGRQIGPDVRLLRGPEAEPLGPDLLREPAFGPLGLALAAPATLLLLAVAGFGWAGALVPGATTGTRVALAPAVGAAALVVVGVALDAAGVPLGRGIAPGAVAVVATVAGYAVARLRAPTTSR